MIMSSSSCKNRYRDLLASTFSGKIVGFTADPAAQDATGAQMVDLCPEGGASAAQQTAKRNELVVKGVFSFFAFFE